jgi:hypothetical protein
MEDDDGARASETLVNIYQTARRNNPEDSHLHKFKMLGCKRTGQENISVKVKLF